MGFFLQLLIGIALQFVGFLLTPRPKVSQPDSVQEMEAPTAEAGRPIPLVFGTEEIKSSNVLWYGEKKTVEASYGGGGKK